MEIITLCIFYIQRPDLQLLGRITRLCLLADHKNALDNSCLHVGINSPLVSQLCNFITCFKANFMSYSFTKLIVNLKVVTRSLGNIILRLLIPLQLIQRVRFPSRRRTQQDEYLRFQLHKRILYKRKILTEETYLPQGCSEHGHTILESLAAKLINRFQSVQKWRSKQFCPDLRVRADVCHAVLQFVLRD